MKRATARTGARAQRDYHKIVIMADILSCIDPK